MREYKVYLSGPMTTLTPSQANGWRNYISEKLPENVHCLSPLRGQVDLDDNEPINAKYEKSLFCNSRAIYTRDKYDCLNSDVIIVNLLDAKRVSIGTMIECGWGDSKGIPIVLIKEKDSIHNHPILTQMASFIVKDLKQAVKVVRSILDV